MRDCAWSLRSLRSRRFRSPLEKEALYFGYIFPEINENYLEDEICSGLQ